MSKSSRPAGHDAGDTTSDDTTSDDLEFDPETVDDLDIRDDGDVQGGQAFRSAGCYA